jgi:predicted O-methyltransferase YrrM
VIGRGEITDGVRNRLLASEDAAFLEIWEKAKPYTMTSFERGHALFRACRYIVERQVPGSFVECGVWRGGSTMIAMLSLLKLGAADRRFYLFDTFDGMTPPSDADKDWQGQDAEALMAADSTDRENSLMWAMATLENVKENVASTGYDPSLVTFVEGDVRETLKKTRTGAIALLRLDTDFYDSTLAELEVLYPRLIQHGMLIIDDYGHWQGARRAVDEYFSRSNEPDANVAKLPMFNWIDYTGRIAVRSQANPPQKIERYDYVPKNLEKVDLLAHFPSLVETDPRPINWPYLRRNVPHTFRTDSRSIVNNIGVLSMEEAHILYNIAKSFAGQRGLEIGCHLGWSTAHLLAAGLDLDVIDPRLTERAHRGAVESSLEAAVPAAKYRLWAGFSPSIVPAVAATDERTYSFAFIDGDHDGEAPRLDVEAVMPHCAETACIMFHDVVSPHVAAGLRAAANAGWQVRVYNTMQVMGVAWRGDFEPFEHIPDERAPAFECAALSNEMLG